MNAQERFSELWTDYLEGELDETGFAELRELLAADEELVQLAADMYQTHRLLGLVVEEAPARQDDFVREVLSRLLPETSDSFVSGVMADVGRIASPLPPTPNQPPTQWHSVPLSRGILAAVAVTLVVILCLSFWPKGQIPVVKDDVKKSDVKRDREATKDDVHFASLAHARFFGELSPSVGSVLAPQREYVLTSGLVELAFPAGASAIVEGPAVFRVLTDESLALDVGRCSVHAPDGAEGFRVETPVTHVIDRGTRFTVSVSESSETVVQVIEGAADVHPVGQGGSDEPLRLETRDSIRALPTRESGPQQTVFDGSEYRPHLPDRIVAFEADESEYVLNDEIFRADDKLQRVLVQRNGKEISYHVSDLIGIELIHFCAGEKIAPTNRHNITTLLGVDDDNGKVSTNHSRRRLLDGDNLLATGVINPGGSKVPLRGDPVLGDEAESGVPATPGFAIRFASPIVNDDGPDVVFFELQVVTNPERGDAFHVSPLHFADGLRAHTVDGYDIDLVSPESKMLAPIRLYRFETDILSLPTLLTGVHNGGRLHKLPTKIIAVGIDLTDLGYPQGASVEGLFFQDAQDDEHTVDPVFIAGLPPIE